jgi:hypothetical protein
MGRISSTGEPMPRRVPTRRASVPAGAAYAGFSTRTIRRWGEQGIITLYRVGPKLLQVDLDEIDRLIRPVATADPVPVAGLPARGRAALAHRDAQQARRKAGDGDAA